MKRYGLTAAGLLGSLLLLVNVVFADSDETFYVNVGWTGEHTGAVDKPFAKIEDALDDADDGDTVQIIAGTYTENIEIPEGVEVIGASKETVIIKADDDDDPTVIMNDQTELSGVTVSDGKTGIQVNADSETTIQSCIISNNDNDGIEVKGGDVSDDYEVTIKDSIIELNDSRGIYVNERMVTIKNNTIRSNKKDGIYTEIGAEGLIKSNTIESNKKNGINVILDRSDLELDNNSIKSNTKAGLYVYAEGEAGSITVKNNTFRKNKRYGIEKVFHGKDSLDPWSGLKVKSGNKYISNKKGKISKVKKV